MKIIKFRTKEFHLAESAAELKTAVKAMYFFDAPFQTHHVQGRIGVMKMIVENNLPISPWIHGLQKSMNVQDRETFDMYVKHLVGDERWDSLKELGDYIKNINPLYRG